MTSNYKANGTESAEKQQLSFCQKVANSVSESDAVHPRFAEPPTENQVNNFHQENDFYCRTCDAFFAPTVLGLREHFKPGRINHRTTKKCIYCKGSVYNYFLNHNIKYYHDCTEKS